MSLRSFLLVLILSGYYQIIIAQCVPDTTMSGLYKPDVSIGLPEAFIGQAYESVIYVHVPTDTNYLTLNLHVDSMVLQSVFGLPDGIDVHCSATNCKFNGGDYGCISLTGFPTDTTEVGDHPLIASFLFYVSGAITTTWPYDIKDYVLTLNSYTGHKESKILEPMLEIDSNPINISTMLRYKLPAPSEYTLVIYTLLGAEVIRLNSSESSGLNQIPIKQYAAQPGIYFATLKQGSFAKTLRFIVQ